MDDSLINAVRAKLLSPSLGEAHVTIESFKRFLLEFCCSATDSAWES